MIDGLGLLLLGDLVGLVAGIFGDLPKRGVKAFENGVDALLDIGVGVFEGAFEVGIDFGQSGSAADDDALVDRGFRRVESVFDAEFLVFEFAFGHGADLQDGDAVRKFGDPLGEAFLIIVGGRDLILLLQFGDAIGDVFLGPFAADDGGRILFDGDFLG